MERMVHNWLYNLAETRGWLCSEYAGFRKLRSCEDQILSLGFRLKRCRPSSKISHVKTLSSFQLTKVGPQLYLVRPYTLKKQTNQLLKNTTTYESPMKIEEFSDILILCMQLLFTFQNLPESALLTSQGCSDGLTYSWPHHWNSSSETQGNRFRNLKSIISSTVQVQRTEFTRGL